MGGIDSLMKYFVGDELVSSTLKKFSCALTELQNFLLVSETCFLHVRVTLCLGSYISVIYYNIYDEGLR